MRATAVVTCATCGKTYSIPRSLSAEYRGLKNNFCSEECLRKHQHSNWVTVVCEACGKVFNVWKSRYERSNTRFCSNGCAKKWRAEQIKTINPNPKNRITVTCEICGTQFEEVQSRIDKNARFCSTKCYGIWRERSGISKGKNNPQYVDGSTDRTHERTKHVAWKRIADAIRNERGNVCEICGHSGGRRKLPVHHIIPWEVSHDDSPENLLVVCQPCHVRLDQAYYSEGIIPFRSVSFHMKSVCS